MPCGRGGTLGGFQCGCWRRALQSATDWITHELLESQRCGRSPSGSPDQCIQYKEQRRVAQWGELDAALLSSATAHVRTASLDSDIRADDCATLGP